MARAQLKHLLLDVDFKDKPKVIDLEETLGALSRLLFIDCLCMMSKATSGGISYKTIMFVAKRIKLKIEDVEHFIKYTIQNEMFFEVDGLYYNSRVIKDQESLSKKRENALERQNKYRDKHVSNALQARDPDTDPVSDTEYIDNKNSAPSGLIKLSEHVRISPISEPHFEQRLKTEGLDEKAKQEIIEALDRHLHKNPEQQKETCHYRDLISWPLREIRKDRSQLSKKDPFKPPEKTIRQIREEAELNQKIKNLGT